VKKLPRVAGKRRDQGQGGGYFANSWIFAKKGQDCFGDAKALSFDCEVGASCDEVEGGAEGTEGGFVDGLDRDDGGDPHGEGEKIQKG